MIYSFDELSFQILTVGHFFHRNGVYDVKPRPFAAFSFRISGTADFEIDNKHFTSSAGDILFLPANMGYKVKYSSDPKSLLRAIAEDPITPAEAIIKVKAAYFPTTALTERLTQLDTNPNVYNDVHTGDLVLDSNGEVKYVPTNNLPIRKYGVDNNTVGTIEFFQMPETDRSNKVYNWS